MTTLHAAASRAAAALACLVLATGALAQGTAPPANPTKPAKPAAKAAKPPRVPLLVEQRAIDLIKAASTRLAAAKAMSFTAVVDIEYPSKLGPPLAYPVRYDVAMARPDKLRVLQSGAGAANEFYYDGKAMLAYVPEAHLVAVADAPPTIEAALKLASDKAAIYYPFMDLLLPDPYAVMTDKVLHAFYIGPSGAVGGVPTEAVAWATNDVFIQMWVGTEDKLPRRIRAMFANDPLKLRHDMQLSNWQIDPTHAADTFASQKAQSAPRIPFAKPVAVPPPPRAARRRRRPPSLRPPPRPRRHLEELTMNRTLTHTRLALAVVVALAAGQALAWASANRAGGSTMHGFGSTTHDNRYGGSTTHTAGEGTEHSNTYGGSTAHSEYGGTEHINAAGGSTAGAYGAGAEHTTYYGATAYKPPPYGAYPVYHPPAYVPYYSTGCYGCAAAAGALVGVATGAAIASANTAATTSSAYSAGVAAGSVSTGAAYSTGYAAGTAAATAPPPGATVTTQTTTTTSYAMGVSYAALPAGSMAVNKNGTTYYLNGNTWFQPMYGANGVHYQVVTAP